MIIIATFLIFGIVMTGVVWMVQPARRALIILTVVSYVLLFLPFIQPIGAGLSLAATAGGVRRWKNDKSYNLILIGLSFVPFLVVLIYIIHRIMSIKTY